MAEISEKQPNETIPFYPDHFKSELRVVWILVGLAGIIGFLALFSPVGLEAPADPMVTPDHVKPEWYFLGLYQLLKFIPKTFGVLAPIVGIILLAILPFYAKKEDSKNQIRTRLIGSLIFMFILIAMTIWGWVS